MTSSFRGLPVKPPVFKPSKSKSFATDDVPISDSEPSFVLNDYVSVIGTNYGGYVRFIGIVHFSTGMCCTVKCY